MARRGHCSMICMSENNGFRFRIVRLSEKADTNSRSGSFFQRSLVLLLWCFLFLVYSKLGHSHNYGDPRRWDSKIWISESDGL
ncbi:unnamed protein product [Brassica rapa subsp. narinosa]|nr:unnamed protein product [Brassica napus]